MSLNSNLYVVKRSVFTLDVSMLGNLDIGTGSNSVSINKDISSSFALDVSGATMIRNTLYTSSIDTDISSGQIYLYDSLRHVTGNLFINNNTSSSASTRIGGGSIIIGGSGVTYIRGGPANQLKIGDNITAEGTVNLGTAASKILVFGDASFNGNVKLGSGSNSVSINKDISAGYALDVSGLAIFRNTMYVASDVSFGAKLFVGSDSSFNGNLSVGGDLSLNSNLYVVKRALFSSDVSINGNVRMGSGTASVAINKDISSSFALDVSGATKFRGAMDVAGVFTVNGAPVTGSGGASLTGNVQVGSNSGFVTIDKPYFLADPSLTIYYNFDTSYNTTRIQNMTNITGLYDGSMNGITAGLTIIDENNPKFGTASLRNTPGSGGKGISIGPINTSIPVSSTMTFSVWVRKPNNPVSPDWDRIFEFSDYTTVGSVPGQQNNTIALDISADGFVYPKLTYNGPSNNSCFTTLSSPIVSYNLCNGIWNHILWVINANKSFIYINGALTQNDNITNFPATTTRASGFIAYSYVLSDVTYGNDFSGNIDNFRYYNNKALNYAEVYQLYNNNFYTFDICGGFLANGSSVIYEPVGSKASANSGSLTLLHGDASGSSSIMFKSVNDTLEYGYIQYEENATGSTGYHYGLLTIGIENDGGLGSYTAQADRISLFPSGGRGFVGVNTKTPQTALDVSGQMRIYEGAGTTATATGGSLTLEHANTGGTSSLVFKASNSSTTSDYAYVQYQDNTATTTTAIPNYKWDLSTNVPTTWSNASTFASTGLSNNTLAPAPSDSSLNWVQTLGLSTNRPSNFGAYCISFNQTNVFDASTTRINYLQSAVTYSNKFSISLWVYPTFNSVVNKYITVASLSSGVAGYCAEISIDGNNQNFAVLFNDGGGTMSAGTTATLNRWHHFVLTYNNITNNAKTYVNGSYAASLTLASVNTFSQLLLGMRYGNNTGSVAKGFRGGMSFVNMFNVELDQTDVTILYTNPGYNSVTTNRGLMTIGIETDNGYSSKDSIVLWPNGGTGFVGINIKDPQSTLDVSGQIQAFSYNATSDYRTKDNVITLDTTFTVDGLNPVTYNFKPTGKQDVGFLAHEVQELYPFLVNGIKDGPNNQSLNYNGFIGILTKEIKDLKKKVLEQSAKALEQSAKALEQDTRIQALEHSVKTLEKFMINK